MGRVVKNYKCSYEPHPSMWDFHSSMARFRYLILGIKSGKSLGAARETARAALGLPPRSLVWVAAPTYHHLDVAERELEDIFTEDLPDVWADMRRRSNPRKWWLDNGTEIQFRSGDWPDNLRGPNVHFLWFDEGGFLKDDAWRIGRQRVTATGGEIVVSTTPPPTRGWLWNECLKSGMPSTMDYGTFSNDDRFVMHYPTEHFGWVPKKELQDERDSLPKAIFDREYGALFTTSAMAVFPNFHRCLTLAKPRTLRGSATVMGLDLARYQDRTFITILDGHGIVHHLERHEKTSWSIQREVIIDLAKEWNSSIVIDRANVGSVISEDLIEAGLDVTGVDMNSPQVKIDLIQSLQVAMEHNRLQIPDPRADWAPFAAQLLVDELGWYEYKMTKGGRIGYSAPRGLTDDGVVSLALAQWGRVRGGGGVDPAMVTVGREEMGEISRNGIRGPRLKSTRPRIFKNIYGRKSALGDYGGGPVFGR